MTNLFTSFPAGSPQREALKALSLDDPKADPALTLQRLARLADAWREVSHGDTATFDLAATPHVTVSAMHLAMVVDQLLETRAMLVARIHDTPPTTIVMSHMTGR